ncbi:metallophosphoesterase [Pseudozobellia sp. WGM2]|uniref:metallophosphoesterase family protein n=1 Tax=Pseudozobellia sp. WGM2 TaxID=2787625 RepID=UPI001ADFA709|nr:metallophosphoesterase [Pseudozobellia sp. WGM2]
MRINIVLSTIAFFILLSCNNEKTQHQENIRIAFISDVHLLDVKGTLQDIGYDGIDNPKTGQKAFIRTMEAQLHSTRLFNENYFAFKEALNDVAERGIKLVALPGDFSDDGQPINVKGLNKILNEYREKHDISFFITTGNHDPTSPFGKEAGKKDFMGAQGQRQPIMSSEDLYQSKLGELPVLVSEDIREMGYEEIVNELSQHGFFPLESYTYWETPFSKYSYDTYSFSKAKKHSSLKNRTYQITEGSTPQPDVSYLVEPIKGLWLVAIDANVYVPKEDGLHYHGTSIGYNQVIKYKKHLVEWVGSIAQKAKEHGKEVVAFSHYPMIDFNDGASSTMKKLFGDKALQAHRIPKNEVARLFADAGLQIHFGGHMHINDSGITTTERGNTLANIQVPSLAAYQPAYKILEKKSDRFWDVETVVLDKVKNYDEFFELYHREYDYLTQSKSQNIWNKEVLNAKDYLDFTDFHLQELVRLRFLPSEWPASLKPLLLGNSGMELLILSNMKTENYSEGLQPLEALQATKAWKTSREMVKEQLSSSKMSETDFTNWMGLDWITDFYRLRSGDELAKKSISDNRLKAYQLIAQNLENHPSEALIELKDFAQIFQYQLNSEPAANFSIDLKKGMLIPYETVND